MKFTLKDGITGTVRITQGPFTAVFTPGQTVAVEQVAFARYLSRHQKVVALASDPNDPPLPPPTVAAEAARSGGKKKGNNAAASAETVEKTEDHA